MKFNVTRRSIRVTMILIVIMSLIAQLGFAGGAQESKDAGGVDSISIIINQSPWAAPFEEVTKLYTETTGINVNLDIVPFDGLPVKGRQAITGPESDYDLINIHPYYAGEFYAGGYFTPLKEIDPNFTFDPEVGPLGGPIYWDAASEAMNPEGDILAFPHTPNFQVLYYRADLYEEAGLDPPKTWDDVFAATEKLADPPNLYGMIKRGERGDAIYFDFFGFMYMFGGSITRDSANGDFTVTINSPEVKEALDLYIKLAKIGPPEPGAIGSSQVIQYLTSGKVLHAEWATLGWGAMDNPEQSAVPGKLDAVVLPKPSNGENASSASLWMLGVPQNLSDERKKAAMNFGEWFMGYDAQYAYFKAGGSPIRSDVLDSELAQESRFRFFKSYQENIVNGYGRLTGQFEEESRVVDILGLRLNQAVTGELSSAEALNLAAEEIHEIFVETGRSTGTLSPLPEN